jgi:coiled-coil domain-containing protein 12
MASTHTTLEAAATDRKARLAKLAALKRKAPSADDVPGQEAQEDESNDASFDVTSQYLSGRNYDPSTKGPRLGFENAPTQGQLTLEEQASKIAISTAEAAKEDEEGDKPIDLFKLQPKKPNWDLKRDLDEKMKVLNARTDNAIARLVRERIQNAQKAAKENAKVDGDKESEELVMEGEALLEGIHAREREGPADEDES